MPWRHLEARHERLGLRADASRSNIGLVPVHVAPVGRLLAHELLALLRALRLGLEAQVLDDVLGRVRDDVARVVEALAPGAARDLLKVAHAEHAHFLAVVLAELREEHRADRHVDADAERVGAADDLEQAALARASRRAAGSSARGPRGGMPMPCRSSFCISLPYGLRKLSPRSASAIALLLFLACRSRGSSRFCAASAAPRCVKLTM